MQCSLCFPPPLLPVDTDSNESGFGWHESNLFFVVVNDESVVEGRAESSTHERACAVRIHSIGNRKGCSRGDRAVKADSFNFGTIAIPVGGEHIDHGERADPDDSSLAGEPIAPFTLTFEHSPACTRDTSPRTSRLTKAMTNITGVRACFIIFLLTTALRISSLLEERVRVKSEL